MLYCILSVAVALSPSMVYMLCMRFLQGLAASGSMAVGGASIADMFEPKDRGGAMGLMFLGVLIAPAVAPTIGGALSDAIGWRSIFYAQAVCGILAFFAVLIGLPETHFPGRPGVKKTVFNPFAAILTLRYLAIFMPALYAGLAFSIFYLYVTVLPSTFSQKFGFSSTQNGLVLISAAIGNVIGALVGGRMSDWSRNRMAARNGGIALPEYRLPPVWVGAASFIVGIIGYGWSLQSNLHYIVPIIFLFFNGIGMMWILTISSSYTVDAYFWMAGAVSSGTAFFRFLLATITPNFAVQMDHALGDGWTFTVCAIVFAVATLHLIPLQLYGEKLRPKRPEM
ncbi:hypothetical protein SmJEL517_g00570 [Synchytrium microbalum]|uniref:Major facilitator superfamily (MFS) profile domain-containing protein n=1 Tax=Synchytrium microbalum TaxID=1806994 RepID=A0A507CEQ5_9FUNG|nr:uncharacterized protein SmJEL517_g00570 [Synchytrium microbalum]TPX37669.1 hypothetical protein SmJEL517_g00570 [Synchytrium microbalum]